MSDCLWPRDCSLPGSSVYGILQARILEWVAISSSRGSSQPRDQTHIYCVFCIGRWVLYHWGTSLVAQMVYCYSKKNIEEKYFQALSMPIQVTQSDAETPRALHSPSGPVWELHLCLKGDFRIPPLFFNPSLDHLMSYMFLFVCLWFFKIYFKWRIITSQYCDGFCHTSTWMCGKGIHM